MEGGEDHSRIVELGSDEGEYSDDRSSHLGSCSRSRSRLPSERRRRSQSRSCRTRTRYRSRSRRSRRRSRSRRSSSRMDCDAVAEEAKLLLESDVIKFCEEHNLDVQPSSCLKCKLVTRSVGKAVLPELIRLKKAKDSVSDYPFCC